MTRPGDGEHLRRRSQYEALRLELDGRGTTALAKPVIGTSVPAPANFAMSS